MAEYTLTTEEVRAEFVTNKALRMPTTWRGAEEFDRWLAAHDAEVRAGVAPRLAAIEKFLSDAEEVGRITDPAERFGTPAEKAAGVVDRAWRDGLRKILAAGVVAEEPESRSLTPEEINALPVGSVVMTETDVVRFGAYEQRVWQKLGGQPDWQFGVPRHEWQSTDGGFERVGELARLRGRFGFNRRVTLLWVPVKQEGAAP